MWVTKSHPQGAEDKERPQVSTGSSVPWQNPLRYRDRPSASQHTPKALVPTHRSAGRSCELSSSRAVLTRPSFSPKGL